MAICNVQIFEPHSDLQLKVLKHLANRNTLTQTLWVACGTKWGKTLGGSGSMAFALPKFPNTVWRWVAPIAKQTKMGRRYIKQILPASPFIDEKISEGILTIPSNNVELQFWHGQNPEDLEGEGITGQVNDECAKMKEQVIISSRTTWTMTRAQVLNISTPRGRNFFYKGCIRAKEEMERALYENREPREVFISAPTQDNPFVSKDVIEEAKRLLPDRLFRQYYNAEFIDNGDIFPTLDIDPCWLIPFEKTSAVDYWLAKDASESIVVSGCDWAKTRDYTVLTCWDFSKYPFRCKGFLRMNGKSYPDQILEVAKFLRKFKSCEVLFHDKTGIGNVIDDLLAKIPNLAYHGITFSNANKAEMVNDLITACELHEIVFPWWPELQREFNTFEVDTDAIGRMKYNAAEGSHDDIVMSCCLAFAAIKQYASRDYQIKFLDDLPEAKNEKTEFEQHLYDSLDIDPDEGF